VTFYAVPTRILQQLAAFGRVLSDKRCHLRHLDLSDNSESNAESIAAIAAGLSDNATLVSHYVQSAMCKPTSITDNATHDSFVQEVLDLSHTGIGVEGAKHLAGALRDNTTLKRLVVRRNEVRDVGARALARVFGDDANISLTELDLSFNHIGDDGIQALYEALRTGSDSCRDKKVLDLNLVVVGNGPSMDLKGSLPDTTRRLSTAAESYEALIHPHLARSKQTLRYADEPYVQPIHDINVWSRPSNAKEETAAT
jgi:Leucine Rich repeat